MKEAPEAVFDRIFNSCDPWLDQENMDGTDFRNSMFADGFNGIEQPRKETVDDVVVILDCTLNEFYNGCLKTFTYSIDQVQHDGRTLAKKKLQKTIQIDPGFSDSTVLTFRGEGNQAPKC